MPVYNGERFIISAIESCLNQLSGNDELVVVDNGSTDATERLVQDYPEKRIKYFVERKRGIAAARNKALGHVQGRFVAFLDSDDLWPDGRQKGLIDLLDNNLAYDAAYGRIRLMFHRADVRRIAHLDRALTPTVLLSPFLFRRKIIERVGEMDETLSMGEDLDYLARIRELGARLLPWDDDAIIYRQHETNATLMHEEARSGQLGMLARKIRRNRIEPT